ncbi:MAG: 50S ribosome-binding GTPase [Bacilli bacterium]|nr:50S ribosome-binding GTPase [Bacilli bacterium]
MNKCLGCGAVLQNEDSSLDGYTKNLNYKYCQRCFKINYYNEYIFSSKSNSDYLKKIEKINKTKDLVILTLDFLNMFDINRLNLNNPILLVITKKDLIPRSVNEVKFLDKIKSDLNIKDKMFISSKNNYNLDLLMDKIYKHKTSNNVYVVGLTNSGKSTLINKILKNYSINESDITTSNLPSTTLDFLEKKVDKDLTLIDTPGLLDDGSILLNSSKEELKKIIPKKEINPIIYQIKNDQSIIIEDFLKVDIPKFNNIILYMSNDLNVTRIYKENNNLNELNLYKINISDNSDLVIKGLGFIKFKNECEIKVYLKKGVKYFVRKSIV